MSKKKLAGIIVGCTIAITVITIFLVDCIGVTVSVKSNPYELKELISEVSVITANVTKMGRPLRGATVKFKVFPSESWGYVSPQTAITDSTGIATVVFYAGGSPAPNTWIIDASCKLSYDRCSVHLKSRFQ